MENTPEPRIDPPEPFCITADCGHEVYEGEALYEWQVYVNGEWKRKTVCPDCFDEYVAKLTREEIADMLGMEHRMIHNPKNYKEEEK